MTQVKTITVKDVIAALEHLVKPLNNTRVSDWGKFHRDVTALIENFVKEELGLDVHTWTLQLPFATTVKEEDACLWNFPLFTYTRDFVEDKNSKSMRGRVLRVFFNMGYDSDQDRTLEQYINLCRVVALRDKLEKHNKRLEALEAEIEKEKNTGRDIAQKLSAARKIYDTAEGR